MNRFTCWNPSVGPDAGTLCKDGLLWYRDIGKHAFGDFSMAVVQANQVLEDQCQIETGRFGTFVGIYDGHGGPDAARYVCDYLFRNFQAINAQSQELSTEETIQMAFLQTEEGFTALVSQMWRNLPDLATTGTCCLVGMIFQENLFVASLGDSRLVLGTRDGNNGRVNAIQLSTEHNANIEAIRQELADLHPHDPDIVVDKNGAWRVKGIIQVTRSIGDVYLKDAQFNRAPIKQKFRLPEPMNMPILSANPTILSHHLQPNDSFLIFASDGLWEYLSNERAVDIVHSNPHAGSAKRLVKAALHEAARRREAQPHQRQNLNRKDSAKKLVKTVLQGKRKVQYEELHKLGKEVRREFHDDISVIVLFLNHDRILRGAAANQAVLSVRSALDH
ncbi:PREDICTED: probable protein phosphatase 2C 42 isoform X1 [Lupinus angustifolius]|uniref:probable protein phosphatase 2C 42 isoform X1 n=1 Tax=Lupinus angustifolius TaxID=3871 RepID=UPI00092F704F|nr:PREDICTED: probable protein phosphatase 2C 42 isoform X1 [Lupinus angustifolius]